MRPSVMVIVLFLLTACGTEPTPTPIAPLTFTGAGETDTARFTLTGDYTLTWQGTSGADGTPCIVGGVLFPADGRGITFGINDPPPRRINGLSGEYYLHMIAPRCTYSVTIQPVH